MTWDIRDRTVLVTGGNSGLGKATAEALARHGSRVVITARDEAKGADAAAEIGHSTGSGVSVMRLDLADLASVKAFSDEFTTNHGDLAVLVNNAGGVFGSRSETVDGFETTFGTNHLGPFLLTSLLTDLLVASAPARVINVASIAHTNATDGIRFDDLMFEEGRYRQMKAYGHSKLANILHAKELNRRLSGRGVTAYSVHPGLVQTDLGRGESLLITMAIMFGRRRLVSPEQGASTAVWLATDPKVTDNAGGYFADRAPSRSTRHATDPDQARWLWEVSESLVERDPPGQDCRR
ncbi:MAG: SDR family oxidoreductase [Acidimicrobiia bacterium]